MQQTTGSAMPLFYRRRGAGGAGANETGKAPRVRLARTRWKGWFDYLAGSIELFRYATPLSSLTGFSNQPRLVVSISMSRS